MPSSFWGLTVIESASSRPATRWRWPRVRPHTAPIAPSICSQIPSARQRAAIAASGSTAPRTVVPAVATTASTGWPARRAAARASAKAAGCRRPSPSTGRVRRAAGGRPITVRALPRETWASTLPNTRAPWWPAKPARWRATTRAIKLLRLPPLASTPPAAAPRPRAAAIQPVSWRSRRDRLGASSSASRLLLRPAQTSSATTEPVRGGGSRWARAPGWQGL